MSIQTPIVDRPATREEGIDAAIASARERAEPLSADALDRLAEAIGDRRYVLIGEASHGTSEFYRWRARLTARLIGEHGFDFVAAEGDWTDCYEVNRFAKGRGSASDARSVLDAFDRWPTWMWANWEVVEFVDWLAEHDEDRPDEERVGFYGMDVYSLFESMRAVVDYLEDVDPEAAVRARDAYACFEPYDEDAREYAQSTRLVPEDCEDEVVEVLTDLRREAEGYGSGRRDEGIRDDGRREDGSREDESRDDRFAAEQNALVVRNAESYYRAMVRGDAESWNVRDRHMVETVERLSDHHDGGGSHDARGRHGGRGIVWAHNTHVGDARATDMARRGEVNVGQLLRESHGDEVALVGFGTHRGSVIAGEAWDAQMERMSVPRAREGSYEDVLHRAAAGGASGGDLDADGDGSGGTVGRGGASGGDVLLTLDDAGEALADPRGHRAIGVVYHSERELGNYVPTVLPDRYDAFLYVDETEALHPLHHESWERRPPETYPWGV